jgi:hypothetical protein
MNKNPNPPRLRSALGLATALLALPAAAQITFYQDDGYRGRAVSTTPAYWDVGYRLRGVQHQLQMNTEPGRTVSVNAAGEPRL